MDAGSVCGLMIWSKPFAQRGCKSGRRTYGRGASSDVARAFLRLASAIRSSSLLRFITTERSLRIV